MDLATKIAIETNNKDRAKNKSVLLFSGGLDSLIISYLENVDTLIFMKHGNKYQDVELRTLQKLQAGGFLQGREVLIKDNIQIGEFERDDAIIPLRNLFFLSFAALYGERLYLASVLGDRTLDKSIPFFQRMEDMMNYLHQDQHWCEGRTFQISTPYKDTTKTELVKKYLDAGHNPQALLVSYSCYTGEEQPCSWCKPCFRKWVALENNNISTIDYFKYNPWEAPWLKEVLPKIKKGEWRGREDFEIVNALKKAGVKI